MLALAQPNKMRPLCFEHHSGMKPCKSDSNADGTTYACRVSGCFVHYSRSDGYFLNTENPLLIDKCPAPPHQYCSSDGFPMYLAEVRPGHPSFRLWRCPKCGLNRAGGEFQVTARKGLQT